MSSYLFQVSSRLYRAVLIVGISAFGCLNLTAGENNYSRTLTSTAWIITSNAEEETSNGTGVLVDAERRLVLTNAHVVGDSRSAVVFFPEVINDQPRVKRKYYLDKVLDLAKLGKIVAVDRKRDLALIQLPELPERAKAIEFAQSSPVPGSSVEMIGNPGGTDVLWAYTSGTVRLVYEKKFKSDHGTHEFKVVETQTPIKPGDSGGPVVNSEGKLVAIAQSFSPQMNLVSYCVDISEIESFIKSPWKPAPLATRIVLENAELEFETHSTGHYEVKRERAGEGFQSVFVSKDTEYYRRADLRRIWSLVSVTKEAPDNDLMMRLMRQSSATKIGSWAIEKNATGDHMVIYVAKVDATAPDEAVSSTIDYVGRIAGAMNNELNPQPTGNSASETLAAWLAK